MLQITRKSCTHIQVKLTTPKIQGSDRILFDIFIFSSLYLIPHRKHDGTRGFKAFGDPIIALQPHFCEAMTESRGERIVFWGPNTNTNIIRVPKNNRIRILFGFPKLTENEYEYYSGFQKWPNTNTNIIRLPKNDQIRIRILFGFPKMTEYEYEY